MTPLSPDDERSLHRSRLRLRVLLALAVLGRAYVGRLARAVGAPPARVRAALVGRLPAYGVDRSLVGLGLAAATASPEGLVFRLTPRGRSVAQSVLEGLEARRTRLDYRDAVLGGDGVPPASRHPRPADPARVPAAPASVSWSLAPDAPWRGPAM